MNKKGFTLIELLAVIIILGILMIIAIPSVTKYINDSRKSSYVDTAKEVIGSARNLVNSGELEMYDKDATYYLDVKCIKTENAMKSPYGEFVDNGAYVIVTFDGQGYDYYWTSVDEAGQGVKNIVKYEKLDADSIESDLTIEDINTKRTLDGRGKVIKITNSNNCKKEDPITRNLVLVSSTTGEERVVVVYPEGKTKDTVVTGDIVTIDTEEFYVVKHDGSDLVLLSHYNLNVGDNKKEDEPEGIQSKNVFGAKSGKNKYGHLTFSTTNYWNEKIGVVYDGSFCDIYNISTTTKCAYVYDSNSNLKEYVDAYKDYLEGQGAIIKEARLLRAEEAYALGCGAGSNLTCSNLQYPAPFWIYETSYWLGSARTSTELWFITSYGDFSGVSYLNGLNFGVRPVIVI